LGRGCASSPVDRCRQAALIDVFLGQAFAAKIVRREAMAATEPMGLFDENGNSPPI
jgi:hypothetical protein